MFLNKKKIQSDLVKKYYSISLNKKNLAKNLNYYQFVAFLELLTVSFLDILIK